MTLIAAPARLSTTAATFEADFAARLHWSADTDAAIEQRVADILTDVQKRGDAAVLEYTARFDGLTAPTMAALELTQAELKEAFDAIPAVQRDALQAAAARVRSYHMAQKKASGESWSYRDEDGTLLGQKVTPLDRVGIYVPGGKAAYPSSVLMNAIPAHVAGVEEIIMVVPTPKGEKNALVLAAAYVAGVTRAFTIGGAQAVAALAAGASGFTHLYNAMSGLHHRQPGMVGAALAHAEFAEVIPDLLHVHPGQQPSLGQFVLARAPHLARPLPPALGRDRAQHRRGFQR